MARTVATTRHIAFLKGINVGGHRVTMERLRGLFEALGFTRVESFIASGNLLFDAPATEPAAALESRIEARLAAELGYAVDTFLRTPAELAALIAAQPFDPAAIAAPATLHVGMLRGPLAPDAAARLAGFSGDFDQLRAHGRELYWLCRGKITDSQVAWPRVARALALTVTMRNVTMLRKLSAKAPPGDPA